MKTLSEYVLKHAVRGDCTCGKCIDAPVNKKQPDEHTINLTFFKVAMKGDGETKEEFLKLVMAEFPRWLDGKEHSYIEIGGDIGSQEIALMTIGLGHLLSAWKCLAPETIMPFLPEDLKQQMAGSGMINLKFENI